MLFNQTKLINRQHSHRTINYPVSLESLQHKKDKLMNFWNNRQNKNLIYTQRSTRSPFIQKQNKINSTNNETTFRSGQGFSHRIKSCISFNKRKQQKKPSVLQNQAQDSSRPGTQCGLGTMKASINDIYPLQVLNSMERMREQNQQKLIENQQIKESKRQQVKSLNRVECRKFLTKGKSIKNSILLNILKSQTNKMIAQTGKNYSGCLQNLQYSQILQKQIPQGMKNSIGLQELFRMTNIFKGVSLKSDDLYEKVNKLITQRKQSRRKKTNPQNDDQETLRSIKRW